ncbi:MAG: NAD(P)H-dependent oxidoreductase subunit E [Alphaproteobacteria bacterium]|jgi:NADH-quinone oxidoreductase subunit E|nr:NAD(P)H-dependent oxidoreductase subunit E [Alphaproteobacteria bacterium]MBR5482615.1 NAD(P)H-dependent oxidoreductase subunit E [Alphaproteobacteria bacterium]
MGDASVAAQIANKWRKKRGSLIMALHELQDVKGYVPWEDAMELAQAMNIPLARIYEVLTFYNFFKLDAPGKAVISVCTGTACYLKGNDKTLEEFKKQLGINEGESTPDKMFHLQCVRCVGCCGLAPVCVVNGKTYGRVGAGDVANILAEWRKKFEDESKE